jgi:alpha-glucosidase
MQPVTSNTAEKPDLLIIHLYEGETSSEFLYYEDDGSTFDYTHGIFCRRLLRYLPIENRFVMQKVEGDFTSHVKKIRVVFHGFKMMNTVLINGQINGIHPETNRFFIGLEKYDPIKDPEAGPEETVMAIEIPYSADEVVVSWQ